VRKDLTNTEALNNSSAILDDVIFAVLEEWIEKKLDFANQLFLSDRASFCLEQHGGLLILVRYHTRYSFAVVE
jgi:hypothetical protein